MNWTVAALYRFTPLADLPGLRARTLAACAKNGICGTLLLAPEGINGTIAGPEDGLLQTLDFLDAVFGIRQGELKLSAASDKPFHRLKVRLKKEIVTLRAPEADPARRTGTYVAPEDWNALIADPDTLVIDTRNAYETRIGMFRGAIDPQTDSFTDFKTFAAAKLDPARHRKIAMYCTGGIRCEKASSYLLAHGFDTVYHLKGGILKYLETVPAEDSLWDGRCFVFDRRVALGHGLEEGEEETCYGCREPLTAADRAAPLYEPGVSCPACAAALTPARARALRERHRRMTE